MVRTTYVAALVLLASCVLGDNTTTTEGETCGVQPEGPWSAALEDWVTSDQVTHSRHGRIMALPPSQGYYVSDRIDLMPPPPPPSYHHGHHMTHRGPYPAYQGPHHGPPPGSQHGPPQGSHQQHHNPPPHHSHDQTQSSKLQVAPAKPPTQNVGPTPLPYEEWQATPPPPPGAGKIVNRPPNPYKDQFKPSFAPPSPPQAIPVSGLTDRVDEAPRPPPHKQVSETDLYLLGAIEKLVYRVDLMEKRLRKMEENVHYIVAGTDVKPEPCPGNFTRLGGGCYHVSSEPLNWKGANYACRKLKGYLLELDDDERRRLSSALLSDNNLKGYDYWTGGLNPGLLWIWSHSAQAVGNTTTSNSTSSTATTVVGEGRCLALTVDPARGGHIYRGQDCSLRHRYLCERDEDKTKLGNEIERVARKLRDVKRIAKMKWNDDVTTTTS